LYFFGSTAEQQFTIHIGCGRLGTSELAVEVEDVVMSGHDTGLWELRHFKQFSNYLFINLHATVNSTCTLRASSKIEDFYRTLNCYWNKTMTLAATADFRGVLQSMQANAGLGIQNAS
jgi:hypothetical protein